jgi:hypothetical protein
MFENMQYTLFSENAGSQYGECMKHFGPIMIHGKQAQFDVSSITSLCPTVT